MGLWVFIGIVVLVGCWAVVQGSISILGAIGKFVKSLFDSLFDK